MSAHPGVGAPPASGAVLREIVARAPHRMTLQLAREHGVPELEVIRAFPDDRAFELDARRWEPLLRAFESLGAVWVLVSNDAATLEVAGTFGGFSTVGDYFNVQTSSLDLHLRWGALSTIVAVVKPGHLHGPMTYSVQFFNAQGAAVLKVFLNFEHDIAAERLDWFRAMVRDFAKPSG